MTTTSSRVSRALFDFPISFYNVQVFYFLNVFQDLEESIVACPGWLYSWKVSAASSPVRVGFTFVCFSTVKELTSSLFSRMLVRRETVLFESSRESVSSLYEMEISWGSTSELGHYKNSKHLLRERSPRKQTEALG